MAAVDEFVHRGDRMVPPLSEIVSKSYSWTKRLPDWWAVVHAVFILGAIGTKEIYCHYLNPCVTHLHMIVTGSLMSFLQFSARSD